MLNVLVLCHGNVNRSPAAAAFLSREPNFRVKSGGFLHNNRRAAAKMRRALQRLGYNLEEHRSHLTTKEDIEAADIVLVMDDRNLREVGSLGPSRMDHVHKLGSFLTPEEKIPDPCWVSESSPQFNQVIDTIQRACQSFTKLHR